MRRHNRSASLAVFALGLTAISCSFPTDKSNEVYAVITASDSLVSRGVLGQGQTDFLFARAWRRLPGGDSVEILNVDFHWLSDDNAVVRVEGKVHGQAEVTGVNVGTVAVRAKAAAFEQSLDAAAAVRVAPAFVIDSVRPATIGYGGKVSVFGVRINQIFFLDQGFGSLIPDEFSFTGNVDGLGRLDYWVPYPATSAHPFYFGPGIFGSLPDSVTVLDDDVYESNWEFPAQVDINGSGGPRTFFGDPVLFYNPALYYEPYDPVTDGPFAIDWYRFARADTTSAVTFIINSQVFDDTAYFYISDSLLFNGFNYSVGNWINAPGLGFYQCGGQGFGTFRETRTPTTYVALRTLPGPAVHLFSNYGKDGPYAIIVINGYQLQDRRLGPDRFEENENWCGYANANFNSSTDSTSPNKIHIVVGLAGLGQNGPWFDSTLTIDNAHDIDWYRFRVQPPALGIDTMTVIRTKSRPFAGTDFSDIDVYVMRASDFAFMGSSTNVGSTEALTLQLLAGDYFLAVVDAASTPTRYALCIIKSTAAGNCTPPGSSPPAQLAPSVYRIPTLPPLAERAGIAKLPFALPR